MSSAGMARWQLVAYAKASIRRTNSSMAMVLDTWSVFAVRSKKDICLLKKSRISTMNGPHWLECPYLLDAMDQFSGYLVDGSFGSSSSKA
jgi:hypothetical protein